MTTMIAPQPLPGSEGFNPEAYDKRVGRHRAKTFGEKALDLASFGKPDVAETARAIIRREKDPKDPTADRDAAALYRLMNSTPGRIEPETANGYQDPHMTGLHQPEAPQAPREPQELNHPTDVGPRAS